MKEEHESQLVKCKDYAEIEKEKALIASEKMHQQEMKEANSQHHEEVKEYALRIDKLQEQHEKTISKQADKIASLEKLLNDKK